MEALDHAIGLGRVGARLTVLHTVPLASRSERISREAGTAVSQRVRDFERRSPEGFQRKGHRRVGGLAFFDGEMHVARGTVDGDVQVASAPDAVGILQLCQVIHVDVDEADLIVPEADVRLAGLLGGWQPVAALGLEDAVDRVPV